MPAAKFKSRQNQKFASCGTSLRLSEIELELSRREREREGEREREREELGRSVVSKGGPTDAEHIATCIMDPA